MSQQLAIEAEEFGAAFGQYPILVRHNLVDEPRLALPAIAELASQLPATAEFIDHSLGDLPHLVPGGKSALPRLDLTAAEIVRSIETNTCRMALRHIQVVPAYRDLMDEVLADAVRIIGDTEGGLVRPEAWIFVNAPHSVVPVHADPEHNFLLQIRGTKRFRVARFKDRDVVAPELERQYRGGQGYFSVMPESFDDFVLTPGTGVYVPPDCPHLVQNGDDASVSFSVIFYTPARDRTLAVHRVNGALRQWGFSPRHVGESELGDRGKAFAARQASRARRLTRSATKLGAHRQSSVASDGTGTTRAV